MESHTLRSILVVLALASTPLFVTAQTNTFPVSGNAGIGTTSPTTKLEIAAGSIGTGAGSQLLGFQIDTGMGNNGYLRFLANRFAAGNGWDGVSQRIQYRVDVSDMAYIDFNPASLGNGNWGLALGTSGADRLVINSAGNVGIGTTSPQMALHVVSTSHEVVKVSSASSLGSLVSISNSNSGVTWDEGQSGGSLGPAGNFIINQYGVGNRLVISPAGNVGIGTDNPNYPLTVNGTVEAKEVIVQTGWSDYVFAPNYRLTPLSEVEEQIKADQHLPGIPSAQEVARHGVNVGDMQARLLAKIEELTLRQIAQEKQLKAQASRIEQLKRDYATLRNH